MTLNLRTYINGVRNRADTWAQSWAAYHQTTKFRATLMLACIVGFAVVVGVISQPVQLFGDFRIAYHPAGVAVIHGASLEPLIQKGVLGFVNLPILAYLFTPFAFLPPKVAAAGPFLLCGVAATALAYVLLVRLADLKGSKRAWFMLLMAANGPLIYSLKLGNTSHVVLAMLAGGLCLLRGQRNFIAGALLAAAALIKLPLLLFGLYFLGRRNWAATLGFSLVLLVAATLSVAVFGVALHLEWFEIAVRTFNNHTLGAFNVQSIQSVLLRLREPAPALFDWSLYTPSDTARVVGSLFVGLLYVITGVIGLRSAKTSDPSGRANGTEQMDLEYMLVICLAVVSSPLSWTHYYCWLLLPIAFLLGGRLPTRSVPWTRWAGVAAAVLVMPVVLLPEFANPMVEQLYARLLVSNYFLGGLLWFAVLARCCFLQSERRGLWFWGAQKASVVVDQP